MCVRSRSDAAGVGEPSRDNNTDTYWQSDGPQPHLVNIQFHKKVLASLLLALPSLLVNSCMLLLNHFCCICWRSALLSSVRGQ